MQKGLSKGATAIADLSESYRTLGGEAGNKSCAGHEKIENSSGDEGDQKKKKQGAGDLF